LRSLAVLALALAQRYTPSFLSCTIQASSHSIHIKDKNEHHNHYHFPNCHHRGPHVSQPFQIPHIPTYAAG
jgi:hypothetical protein